MSEMLDAIKKQLEDEIKARINEKKGIAPVEEEETPEDFRRKIEGNAAPSTESCDDCNDDCSCGDDCDCEGAEPLPKTPLEEAVERALYSLEEIRLCGMYGRTAECEREATDALAAVGALYNKHKEQNAIMDALSKPMGMKTEEEFA